MSLTTTQILLFIYNMCCYTLIILLNCHWLKVGHVTSNRNISARQWITLTMLSSDWLTFTRLCMPQNGSLDIVNKTQVYGLSVCTSNGSRQQRDDRSFMVAILRVSVILYCRGAQYD